VVRRAHRLATVAWAALACGAGLGFAARDLVGAEQPAVALAWIVGALAAAVPAAVGPSVRSALTRASRSLARAARRSRDDGGQATIEWTGLLLVVALVLGALVAFGPRIDGWSFGGFLAHHFTCAVKGGCRDGDRALVHAYGERDAARVREYAPNLVYEPGERQLPVDWRRCRRPRCANAPDEPDVDVHRSDAGERATVFTHLLRKDGRTYIQYWLYFPDSNTVWAASDKLWEALWLVPRLQGILDEAPPYPGFHRDDWEGYVVRLDPDGTAWVRASSHGHWQSCKDPDCEGDWTTKTGWTRVSRGSHAGHIPLRRRIHAPTRPSAPRQLPLPGAERREPLRREETPLYPGQDLDERTTTGEGLRLIPLETHDTRRYRRNSEKVKPPWEKDAYRDPESDGS
jgi:hypothetical protein